MRLPRFARDDKGGAEGREIAAGFALATTSPDCHAPTTSGLAMTKGRGYVRNSLNPSYPNREIAVVEGHEAKASHYITAPSPYPSPVEGEGSA